MCALARAYDAALMSAASSTVFCLTVAELTKDRQNVLIVAPFVRSVDVVAVRQYLGENSPVSLSTELSSKEEFWRLPYNVPISAIS